MSDLITEPLPKQRPIEQHTQIETDLFCEHCSYNLHGQVVTRDERLGLMVCRCPECGRFHPAGHKTTAPVLWLGRLATLLLLVWVVIVLALIFWGTFGLGALQAVYLSESTYRRMVGADGSTLVTYRNPNGSYTNVHQGTTRPYVGATRYVYTLNPPSDSNYVRDRWENKLMVALLSTGIALPGGVLLVVVFWHWKRRTYYWMLLFPYFAAAFVVAMVQLDTNFELIRDWATRWTVTWASFQALVLCIGIQIGRPVARGLIRMFIPPRPRQFLAFLWQVDGKTLPLTASPAGRTSG